MRLVSSLLVAFALACSTPPSPSSSSAPSPIPSPSPTPVPPPSPARLEGDAFVHLTDRDNIDFHASIPIGTTTPRPVVLGVHGAGDRPDWSCTEWRASLRAHAFVICPHGFAQSKDAYAWGSAEAIWQRAERALETMRAQYGAYMSDGPMIYGGWSQGATLASNVVAKHPRAFDAAILVEIGYTPLNAEAVAAELVRGGVGRAMVACSSVACRKFAAALEGAAPRAKLQLHVHDVGLRGHWFDGPMFRELEKGLPWLVEGDPRWSGS